MIKHLSFALCLALGTLLYGLFGHQLDWKRALFVGIFGGLASWRLAPWLSRRAKPEA